MVEIWSWNRNLNRNRYFSKVGTGTITFQKLEPEPYFSKVGTGTLKKVTVPQRCYQGPAPGISYVGGGPAGLG
jgi:hypothetical protein